MFFNLRYCATRVQNRGNSSNVVDIEALTRTHVSMIARATSCSTGTKNILAFALALLTRKYCDANDNITARQGRGFSDSLFNVTRVERVSGSQTLLLFSQTSKEANSFDIYLYRRVFRDAMRRREILFSTKHFHARIKNDC